MNIKELFVLDKESSKKKADTIIKQYAIEVTDLVRDYVYKHKGNKDSDKLGDDLERICELSFANLEVVALKDKGLGKFGEK